MRPLLFFLLNAAPAWADPGFDEKYERDYNIFNPINQYRPDNPLNPINSVDPNNPFNPINRSTPAFLRIPSIASTQTTLLIQINEVNPNNPLNPINRSNPDTPFKPLR